MPSWRGANLARTAQGRFRPVLDIPSWDKPPMLEGQRATWAAARIAHYVPSLEDYAQFVKVMSRSLALLYSLLDERQRAELDSQGGFSVVGSAGRRYWIQRGSTYNVARLDAGGLPRASLCFRAGRDLPVFDHMLAQKLALEADEPAALAAANLLGFDPIVLRDALASLSRSTLGGPQEQR